MLFLGLTVDEFFAPLDKSGTNGINFRGLFFMDFLQMDALSKEQTLTVLDNLRKFLTDDNKAN